MEHHLGRPGGASGSGYSYRSNGSSLAEEEDDKKDQMGMGANAKRQRVHFSCTECHRRKQKCNRETPCQHCIARKIPDRCKTFQPGEDPSDLSTRVGQLERMVHDNFERLFDMMERQPQPTPAAVPYANSEPAEYHPAQGDAAGSEAGDEVFGGGESPRTQQFGPASKTMSMKIDSLIHTFSSTEGTSTLTDPVRSIEGAADLDALMQEYGATESIAKALVAIFPTREKADVLLDHFFLEINWLRQPLSQKLFRQRYEAFWASGPTLTANNINDYAVLIVAMAIAICSIERADLFPDDARAVRLTARRLFFAGRKALLVSTVLGREDIQQVMGYSLASRFLLLDRRITEAWTCVANAVKTAHSIGLHRDGSKLHLTEEESEMRRRVWSSVYFTDRNLCMNLGRPTQIDDQVVDTQMPSEEDDYDVFPEMFKPASNLKAQTHEGAQPPSPLSYTKHRHQLAVIMGKIISTYQNLHTPAHYSDIVSIDKEIESYRKKLPAYFRSEINSAGDLFHLDQSWDLDYPFVAIHRYLLDSEIDHIRVSLHRPYLLRSNHKTGHRYEYSRRSCIAAAHHNILLRRDVIDALKKKYGEGKVPKVLHLHLGTYRTLNSLIIIGVYLLVTPDAEDAELLLGHLRFYVEHWKKKRAAKAGDVRDEMKDREASIIQLFLQRIEETRAERANAVSGVKREEGRRAPKRKRSTNMSGTGKAMSTDEDTAGVLLDLNQSGRSAAADKEVAATGTSVPPWPYLPMNTHHSNTSGHMSSASLGTHGNGAISSPVNTSTSHNSEDGVGTTNATAAQQLFESWFRYNAFDTMDFDTLNANLVSTPTLDSLSSQQQPTAKGQHSQNAHSQAMSVFANPTIANTGSGEGASVGHAADVSLSASSPGYSSSVQLSTVPAPVWNFAKSGVQGGQGIGGPGALADMTGTMTGLPMPFKPAVGGAAGSTTGGAAMGADGGQFIDSSFDPNFWQSLIDKIAS